MVFIARGPKSNESKGEVHQPPNHQWAHLSQFWPQIAKNHLRTHRGHKSVHGLWQPPEATSSAQKKDSPPVQGKTSTSSMHPVLKDPGVVHIWFNIPLCTIFVQQSDGDIFRTKLSDPKSSPQSITIHKGVLFCYSVWQFPGGYQTTI
ncbi:hypothetical protein O181_116650 [Austropuccinia psidii MF-1]|uniref:Uncharacterized protein n=1 Tax=Austropuccinia psidii MF-1 TaxID=1389203 RepID=A0A9Q3PXM7_9BASI|nr:hypothetical protein [Austropuccinia psidii MF-1]